MMSRPYDEPYLNWLYRQVADPDTENQKLTFWEILHALYLTEFISCVSFDENRIADAKNLRKEFVRDEGVRGVDPEWIELGCSMLELMVGLSRRLAFEGDGQPHYWFWFHLMKNLGFDRYNDLDLDGEDLPDIEETLDRVIYRHYDGNGHGGFFPLEYANEDQRGVELWYQLNAYLNERDERKAHGEDVL